MPFKITNMTTNPRVFTDRHGRKIQVPPMGVLDEADITQDDADYINELRERGTNINAEGSESKSKAAVAKRKSGDDSVIARQTLGDPSRTSAPIGQGVEDLNATQAELADLQAKRARSAAAAATGDEGDEKKPADEKPAKRAETKSHTRPVSRKK